jgi:hypothetical protein
MDHRDYELLFKLEGALYRHAGGQGKFETDIPALFRQAIDEVIDPARSSRFLLEELQNSEKTYIGTKIEIILRNHLKLPRGTLLDVVIDGVETDVKNTVGTSWMIPVEAIGHPCILIRMDERTSKCWFGLIIAHAEILNPGGNRDKKATISAQHFVNVLWMLYAHPYPRNFWEDVDTSFRSELLAIEGGNSKVVAFFKRYLAVPIPRQVFLAFAPQDDTMKRLRKNGGAPDRLRKEGIALLSGKYKAALIQELGLPACTPREFIAIRPSTAKQWELLRREGLLD